MEARLHKTFDVKFNEQQTHWLAKLKHAQERFDKDMRAFEEQTIKTFASHAQTLQEAAESRYASLEAQIRSERLAWKATEERLRNEHSHAQSEKAEQLRKMMLREIDTVTGEFSKMYRAAIDHVDTNLKVGWTEGTRVGLLLQENDSLREELKVRGVELHDRVAKLRAEMQVEDAASRKLLNDRWKVSQANKDAQNEVIKALRKDLAAHKSAIEKMEQMMMLKEYQKYN